MVPVVSGLVIVHRQCHRLEDLGHVQSRYDVVRRVERSSHKCDGHEEREGHPVVASELGCNRCSYDWCSCRAEHDRGHIEGTETGPANVRRYGV